MLKCREVNSNELGGKASTLQLELSMKAVGIGHAKMPPGRLDEELTLTEKLTCTEYVLRAGTWILYKSSLLSLTPAIGNGSLLPHFPKGSN